MQFKIASFIFTCTFSCIFSCTSPHQKEVEKNIKLEDTIKIEKIKNGKEKENLEDRENLEILKIIERYCIYVNNWDGKVCSSQKKLEKIKEIR